MNFWNKISCALLLLLLPLSSFALYLTDSESFIYDVGEGGRLQRGTQDAYASMYLLRVNGTNYQGQIVNLSAQGRQAHTTVFTEPHSGLEIERRVYVAKSDNFARYTEILYNPTDTDVNVEVEVYGNLGSGNNTQLIVNQDNFLITAQQTAEEHRRYQPVLVHYHSQGNNPIQAVAHLANGELKWGFTTRGTQGERLNYVTIPAQARIRLIYFIAQTTNVDTGYAMAYTFFSNTTMLYEGMTATELREVINFSPPQPNPTLPFTDVISLAPGQTYSGRLLNGDAFSRQRAATLADVYGISLTTGQQVTIQMSAHFNAYLYLFADELGTQVVATNNDASSDTTNARLLWTVPETKTYYLEATAHNREAQGDYTVEVREGIAQVPPRAFHLEFPVTPLTAPATVTFTDFSRDPDGFIAERCWRFNDGTPLVCSTEVSTITHTFEHPGYYNVSLSIRDNEGHYAARTETVAVAVPPLNIVLPFTNTVNGELVASDGLSQSRPRAFADRYLINSVAVGQELVIDMQSNEFDGYLYLYDEFNRLLRQEGGNGNRQARIRYLPTTNHNLIVEATSFQDNAAGTYNLTLSLADTLSSTTVLLEAVAATLNPLENLFVARFPNPFKPTFLRWNFGDGSPEVSTNEAVVAHTYTTPGYFSVRVIAVADNGQQATGQRTFTINNQVQPLTARFRVSPLFGESPLQAFLTNESSSALGGDLLSYLWQFGDGSVSTDLNPSHSFLQEGTYHVILRAFSNLTHQSASYSMPVTVIDRSTAHLPIAGIARARPQVLMAGLDPMIVDVLDTDLKAFALVRPGKMPIQTVRVVQNGTDFTVVMQQVATYANGDQRYEAVYTFPRGEMPVGTYAHLFGEKTGQLKIQAIDQNGQFHAFPDLEVGESPIFATPPATLNIEPLQYTGIRRKMPQVLAVGFDPALVDKTDSHFTVKAIVREGLSPIDSVVIQLNQSDFQLPMHWLETLPNGDKIYATAYTYPYGNLAMGTLGNLFGDQAGQFVVTATDQLQQSHRFPEFKIGNFPQQ